MILNGFLNVFKPPGATSHDIVKHIRELVPGLKVGHGGTLDPGAEGVLPLLIGKATRLSSYLLETAKLYKAGLILGISTDTEDFSGEVLFRREIPISLGNEEIEKALKTHEGELWQVPPMYAAVKKKGKKLYEYARKGITVEREPRKVVIYSIKLIDYFPPRKIIFEVECSKGTYIRTLCRQIGDYLGYGGHMSFLLRKSVGPFILSQSRTIQEVKAFIQSGRIQEIVLPLDFVFQDLEPLYLDEEKIRILCQGQHISSYTNSFCFKPEINDAVDEQLVPVYTTKREFVLLARWKTNDTTLVLKPEKVFKSI